jgi:hypothetical protein
MESILDVSRAMANIEPALHPAQVEALRRMTIGQRIALTASLWEHIRALKAATLQALHPDWTRDEIELATRKVMQRGSR